MKNFWHTLPHPFFVQAPMEDAADSVFRQIIAKCGKPDVFFTEFTSTDAIVTTGFKSAMTRLVHTNKEIPIVAQLWGNDPEKYKKAIPLLKKMGFSGVDINMGCPVNKVIKRGYCSGLIQNPKLAKEIIAVVKKSAGKDLAVSVKTRIGYTKISHDWIRFLLEQNLDALTLHLRTTKELSLVPAHWEEMKEIVSMKNNISKHTIIIGNGDIKSRTDGVEKAIQYGVDGVMIGRGALHNPWVFHKTLQQEDISIQDKLRMLIDHIQLFEKTWNGIKSFHVLKKHYKAYVNNYSGASDLRSKLVRLQSAKETIEYIEKYILQLKN